MKRMSQPFEEASTRAMKFHVNRAILVLPGNPDLLVGGVLAVAATHLGDVGGAVGIAVLAGFSSFCFFSSHRLFLLC